MSINNRLNAADIDYQNIRDNLKDFLKDDPNFTDYDFDGSALSSIIDLLSYVTHINAINANIGINETFLETAQFRGSVVGHARTLGYTPRSATAPIAFVRVQLNGFTQGVIYNLPRGYRFKTTIDGRTFFFVATDDYQSNTNGVFENVRVAEGTLKSAEYVYDPLSFQRFLIPDSNADVSTLSVEIQSSRTSSVREAFTLGKELPDITAETNAYFIAENSDGLFEVFFGDGVIGRQPEPNNIIRLEYVSTNIESANGARVFSSTDKIEGLSASVQTVSPARGGIPRETINSIKRNAPLSYASQNRGVTPRDYESIVRENFANVSSIRVWGGEDNTPPVYGKVFVSILPRETEILSIDEKSDIVNRILIPKSVATITPEIIDPEFLFITSEVFFKYDPSRTNLTESQLRNKVNEAIKTFSETELNQFDGVFRYSNFLNAIDRSDDSILNSFARIFLQRRFIPALNVRRQYEIDYVVPLLTNAGDRNVINKTTEFTVGEISRCRLKDFPTANPNRRRVAVVTGTGQFEQEVRRDVGFIEGSRLVLNNFVPSAFVGSVISIEVVPDSFDIVGEKNIVLAFDCDCDRFNITAEIDSSFTPVSRYGN